MSSPVKSVWERSASSQAMEMVKSHTVFGSRSSLSISTMSEVGSDDAQRVQVVWRAR